ncbi:repressor LexA [Candidatus Calescamantes bacterium]|nr:repressor LexA [Candidatus Calescamantes bacterium]MCK5599063.1 repressor LexA [bacterium]
MSSYQLTKIQRDTLDFIIKFYRKKSYTPTLTEIAKNFGISIRAAYDRVNALIRKGYIEREKGARTIKILELDLDSESHIPLLGKISAGIPLMAEENIETYIPIRKEYFPAGEYFSLKVIGDSMINAGIIEGDILVVRQQNYAQNGEIVVAMFEGETTVKRIFFENKMVVLQPENPEYERMIKRYVSILGKVEGLIRRY